MKVLTENKEELAIKDLIECDMDDIPVVRERDNHEEVELGGAIDDGAFEDDGDVSLDDEFEYDTNSMFEDDDDEIDTTIPDAEDFDAFDDDEFDLDDED